MSESPRLSESDREWWKNMIDKQIDMAYAVRVARVCLSHAWTVNRPCFGKFVLARNIYGEYDFWSAPINKRKWLSLQYDK